MPSMEPEFALRMERQDTRADDLCPAPSMEPEFALRMELDHHALVIEQKLPSMEPEFALRMEPLRRHTPVQANLLQWSRSLHSGWNVMSDAPSPITVFLQWSRSLHSGWNCSLKIAKENKPCKRLFRAPERRGRIFLSIQHGGRKNSFILADCHCENPPL